MLGGNVVKKFTSVSLARTKKSATSALMGLAILFVTLNFVSATLSTKVYSSNPSSLKDIDPQNDESEDENPTNIDEKTLKKDTNLIDFLDCLYGDHRYKYPNLTESIAKSRFDEALHQKSYEKILNSHVIKSSINNEQFTDYQNNDTDNDSNDFGCSVCEPFENENIILTYDNRGSANLANWPKLPNAATQPSSLPIPRYASDNVAFSPYNKEASSSDDDFSYSEGGSFHRDGSPNLLAQAPDIPPPAGLFEKTTGSHSKPNATSTYHFYSPGATGENESDDFPSVLYSTYNHFSYPPDTK